MTGTFEQIEFHIRGTVPLMMHNGQLSDPLNPYAQALDAAQKKSKKVKTEANLVELARVEFMGSLYVDDGEPCIPGEGIEAMIRAAAKQSKQGKQVQTGLFCEGNWKVIYDGPKEPEKLWESRGDAGGQDGPLAGRRFVDRRRCKIQGNAVMRTRPIFPNWELKFVVSFDPEALNRRSVVEFVELAGQVIGLYEGRPRFGRFEVVKVS